MAKAYSVIRMLIDRIAAATVEGENTAARVGGALGDILDYAKDNTSDAVKDKVTEEDVEALLDDSIVTTEMRGVVPRITPQTSSAEQINKNFLGYDATTKTLGWGAVGVATQTRGGFMSKEHVKQLKGVATTVGDGDLGETPYENLCEAVIGLTDTTDKNAQAILRNANDITGLRNEVAGMRIELSDYATEGAVLPTLNASFLYDGKLTHHRTIYDVNGEISEGVMGYYHVFCAEHDREEKPDVTGVMYFVYDADLAFYKLYDAMDEEVPDIILRAFGEALATEEYAGLMSAEDKAKLDGIPEGGGGGASSINVTSLFDGESVPYTVLQLAKSNLYIPMRGGAVNVKICDSPRGELACYESVNYSQKEDGTYRVDKTEHYVVLREEDSVTYGDVTFDINVNDNITYK